MCFRGASEFVRMWHRHHQPPQGHVFSVGAADRAAVLRAVAIVGRPVARYPGNGTTLDVTSLARALAANVCRVSRSCGTRLVRMPSGDTRGPCATDATT
nr:XF1762 family protein [Streptomyces rimosus]